MLTHPEKSWKKCAVLGGLMTGAKAPFTTPLLVNLHLFQEQFAHTVLSSKVIQTDAKLTFPDKKKQLYKVLSIIKAISRFPQIQALNKGL